MEVFLKFYKNIKIMLHQFIFQIMESLLGHLVMIIQRLYGIYNLDNHYIFLTNIKIGLIK
jgi:hypothetical protein